jgi:DNA-binding MurR/RpiR family transcriptional regulator
MAEDRPALTTGQETQLTGKSGNDVDNLVELEPEKEAAANPGGNLLHRLRQKLALLSPTERQIGEYVLEQPGRVLELPIDQLAKEVGVSPGTIGNFCQSLGYPGYRAFRLDLAAEVKSPLKLNQAIVSRGDSLAEIADKSISASVDALLTTRQSIDLKELEKVITGIKQARRIDLYGYGISGAVAYDAFTRLWQIGLPAHWYPDMMHQVAGAALITDQDVAIAFSGSGETIMTVKALKLAYQEGALTVAVTSNPHSPLVRYARVKLVITPREPSLSSRTWQIASRMAMLGIVDIIHLVLLDTVEESTLKKIEQYYRPSLNEPKPEE